MVGQLLLNTNKMLQCHYSALLLFRGPKFGQLNKAEVESVISAHDRHTIVVGVLAQLVDGTVEGERSPLLVSNMCFACTV
jgi:hypothetical protein